MSNVLQGNICILLYDWSILKLRSKCLSGIYNFFQFDMRLSHIIKEEFRKIKTRSQPRSQLREYFFFVSDDNIVNIYF